MVLPEHVHNVHEVCISLVRPGYKAKCASARIFGILDDLRSILVHLPHHYCSLITFPAMS